MTRGLSTARSFRLGAALACLAASAAVAQSSATKAAQEELDRQLRELVGKPPTRVKVTFNGLDEPGYQVEEVAITLDGRPLSTPAPAVLSREGEHLVFQGDHQPGDHRLEARVTIADASGQMFSYEAGYKWKTGVSRTFNLQPGLEVHVALTPQRDPSARQVKDKFKLSSTATPRMLAALDDGKMPEPAPRPKVAVAEVPDAGAPVPPVDAAEEAKRLAAEEKKRQAEAAAEAKRLAAEEKKRKAEEAKAARLAAAEEKKRQAEEAKAARLAAAEEKKRQAEAAKAARLAAAEEKRAVASGKLPPPGTGEAAAVPPAAPVDAGAPEVVDAGAPEPVDAGAPPPPVEPPAVAKKPPPPPAEEGGLPWVAFGAGVGLLIAVLIVLARRRANPRDPNL